MTGAPVAVAVLAAGASTRMGQPKQLLPFRGNTLLHWVVEQAVASSASRVLVILGAHSDIVAPTLDGLPVETIFNPDWEEGQAASVRAAVRFLKEQVPGAVLFLLGDQPFVTTEAIDLLIATHRRTGSPLVASEQDRRLGVPALFSAEFFDELTRLRGDAGARQILHAYRETAVGVPLPGAELDVDTPADYARLIAEM
jgi:molybdenum cofactor cytidylyltransferase